MGNKKGVKRGPYKMSQKKPKLYATMRYTKHRVTKYKQPEDFPQWNNPADTFDIQQVMKEIVQ